jgi:hypothetical protein
VEVSAHTRFGRDVRRALVSIALGALGLVAIVPGVARADAPAGTPSKEAMEEARVHYSRGVQLYTDGSYDAALVELERAYKLAPSFKILYSIGLVQLRLNDLVGAKGSFERYLAEGGSEVPAARKTEVDDRLTQLTERIATVDVRTNVPEAEVFVDDISVGKTPLAKPIALNPGYHKIAVSKSGYTGEARQLGFAGGDKAQLQLQLAPLAPAAPTLLPGAQPTANGGESQGTEPKPLLSTQGETPSSAKGVWIGWTITGVLAAGAVVTGIAALNQSSKLTDQVDKQPTPASDISSTRSKTVTLALVTDVLGGAAIVAGGVSLYFTLATKKESPRAAHVRVGPGSIALQGSF